MNRAKSSLCMKDKEANAQFGIYFQIELAQKFRLIELWAISKF